MKHPGQLLWLATPVEIGERRQVHFMMGLGTGLADADFHPIGEREWPAMASPTPDAVAVLEAPPEATLAQIEAAVTALMTQGHYRFVQIASR